MKRSNRVALLMNWIVAGAFVAVLSAAAQETNATRTMRPVIRGRFQAVTSMKPEATWAAEQVLRAGGNAFDAVVAGQAALGVVDAAANGVGSDAVLLVYDAREKKVWSLNAEGTAPALATIEWYQKNNGGKLPVVDKDRNMITFTPSLHSGFGTGVVMGDLGFFFNCRGDYYSLTPGEANALAPGKRPRSTLQGTLVTKDGQPHMVMGSPGGDDQVMRTMQTFLNLVEFGMNVQQAIEAPRWSTRSFPASPFPHTMYPGEMSVESRIPESARQALIAKGHKLKVSDAWSMGNNAAIVVDLKTGLLSAGADPRIDAYAWAW